MERCILCSSELPRKNKTEHILLNALGGKKTSTRLICASCNSRMGNGPDKELADSVAAIRSVSGFRSGDDKPPPTLKNVLIGPYGADIRDGKISPFIKNPLKIKKLEEGLSQIEIKATTRQQLESLLESGFEQLKVPSEKRDELRRQFLDGAKIEHKPAPPFELKLSFGSTGALRSMAKSVFEIWALEIGNANACRPEYDQIRAFILGADWSNNVEIDTRPLPSEIRKKFIFPNLIWVGSDDFGHVWGYFSLYGLCAWSFRICNDDSCKKLSSGLINNPIETQNWEFGQQVGTLIDVEWVKSAQYNEDNLRASFKRLHDRNREKTFSEFVEKSIAETMEKTGTQFGDRIEDKFINDLSHRVANAITKFPWDEPLKR